MSSKKKKGDGKSGETWEKGEEIFQGVILTDSFNFRFLPITFETPRVSGFILESRVHHFRFLTFLFLSNQSCEVLL